METTRPPPPPSFNRAATASSGRGYPCFHKERLRALRRGDRRFLRPTEETYIVYKELIGCGPVYVRDLRALRQSLEEKLLASTSFSCADNESGLIVVVLKESNMDAVKAFNTEVNIGISCLVEV